MVSMRVFSMETKEASESLQEEAEKGNKDMGKDNSCEPFGGGSQGNDWQTDLTDCQCFNCFLVIVFLGAYCQLFLYLLIYSQYIFAEGKLLHDA